VVAVVTSEKFDWLREELGSDAPAVEHVDANAFYDGHGPMFSAVVRLLERYGTPGAGRLRLVAEHMLALRAPAHVRAYMRYEAASNVAVCGHDASILCPYDATRLPDEIIDAALRTHPEVVETRHRRTTGRFMDPRAFVRQYVREPTTPPATPACRLTQREDLVTVRAWARSQAQAAGLPVDKVEDLALAVSEVATNALLYGDDPRLLWSYVEDGHLVYQIRDRGPGPADPLAGYLPPDEHLLGGRGLWLAHQLCDIVEIVSDEPDTDVHLHMRLPASVP
jgi:anti-sigma regulatory factor (Ser/Thr protein kinase)